MNSLKFSNRIEELTDKFVERHGKFMAVQWRMERSLVRLNLQQLRICAKGLINTLIEVGQKEGISKVFLALDLSPNDRCTYYSYYFYFSFLSLLMIVSDLFQRWIGSTLGHSRLSG